MVFQRLRLTAPHATYHGSYLIEDCEELEVLHEVSIQPRGADVQASAHP